jgi:malonyl-CoA O-methyltransferase
MLVSALEGHRLWAEMYEAAANPLLALEARLLPDVLGPLTEKRVVDVACGTGRWMARFDHWGANAIGIDFCAAMLARAMPKLRGKLALADAVALPITNTIADLTVCSFGLGYFASVEGAIQEMARITKPGGRVILSDFHPAAVARGWKRSFRLGSVLYEMEHFAYTLSSIEGAAAKAGLRAEMTEEASCGDPERAIFVAAGKADLFEEACQVPVLWIKSWTRV